MKEKNILLAGAGFGVFCWLAGFAWAFGFIAAASAAHGFGLLFLLVLGMITGAVCVGTLIDRGHLLG